MDYEEDEALETKGQDEVKKGGTYSGIHASGFRDFLLKPELLRAVVDCDEHPRRCSTSASRRRSSVWMSCARPSRAWEAASSSSRASTSLRSRRAPSARSCSATRAARVPDQQRVHALLSLPSRCEGLGLLRRHPGFGAQAHSQERAAAHHRGHARAHPPARPREGAPDEKYQALHPRRMRQDA